MKKLLLKNYIWISLGLVSSLVSCGGDTHGEASIYPKDSMINVLMDIHLAEARIESTGYRNVDTARADFKKLEAKVFKKHKIDTSKYRKSFTYYTDHIDLMSEIYNCIRDSFKLKDSLIKASPREAAPSGNNQADSLKKNTKRPPVNRKSTSKSTLKAKN